MEIFDKNFEEEVLNFRGIVLVDFFATWCGPCQMQGTILDELEKEIDTSKSRIVKVDVDKNPQLAEKYEIMSIPTLIIFDNGEKKETIMGLQNKETLKIKLSN